MLIAAINAYNAIMTRSNAMMSIMANQNAMTSMMSNPAFMSGELSDSALRYMCEKETNMQCENLTNSMLYKIAELQEESAKKMLKENIEDSFDTFA